MKSLILVFPSGRLSLWTMKFVINAKAAAMQTAMIALPLPLIVLPESAFVISFTMNIRSRDP